MFCQLEYISLSVCLSVCLSVSLSLSLSLSLLWNYTTIICTSSRKHCVTHQLRQKNTFASSLLVCLRSERTGEYRTKPHVGYLLDLVEVVTARNNNIKEGGGEGGEDCENLNSICCITTKINEMLSAMLRHILIYTGCGTSTATLSDKSVNRNPVWCHGP